MESLDAMAAADIAQSNETGSSLEISDSSAIPSDAYFDRQWALAIMDRALTMLENDLTAGGKCEQFQILKPWLAGDSTGQSQAEAAQRLSMTEGAVKVAVHRLRKKFRDAVRTEVAHTLTDPSLIDEELQHLVQALAAAGN